MGEIAEMMLDGTMCQVCGEWLNDGEDGPGYPGYCSSCRPSRNKKKPVDADPLFALKHKGSLAGLNQFLAGIDYGFEELAEDKKGKPMFRLYHHQNLAPDTGWGVTKLGVVVVMDRGLLPLVQKAIDHHRKANQ